MGKELPAFDKWVMDQWGQMPGSKQRVFPPGSLWPSPVGQWLQRTLKQQPAGIGLPQCPHARLVGKDASAGQDPVIVSIEMAEPRIVCPECFVGMGLDSDGHADNVCRLCSRPADYFNEFAIVVQGNLMVTGKACTSCWRKQESTAQG